MKRTVTLVALFAALVSASVASAATTSVSAANNPPSASQVAYPLTITVQPALKGGGEDVPFVITVTNHATSPKLTLAPVVFLDYYAVPAAHNPHLIYAYSKLYQARLRTWAVGNLAPGQTKTITLWYNQTVSFPPYTDPTTGVTYTSPSATIGQNYFPVFQLYDNHYDLYTTATPATPAFLGGKGGK
jgi:hypothetical protein